MSVVPVVMIPNRVFLEAHTWPQSITGAVLATTVVVGFYAVRESRTRRTNRAAG